MSVIIVICRHRLSSVVVCSTPRQRNVTHQLAARDDGPVVLRPVRATPCWTKSRPGHVYSTIWLVQMSLIVAYMNEFTILVSRVYFFVAAVYISWSNLLGLLLHVCALHQSIVTDFLHDVQFLRSYYMRHLFYLFNNKSNFLSSTACVSCVHTIRL